MAVKVTGSKLGTATTVGDTEAGRMVKRTSKIPGSVLRKTTGLDSAIKMKGQKPNRSTRGEMIAATKAGRGGFTSIKKASGRGARPVT